MSLHSLLISLQSLVAPPTVSVEALLIPPAQEPATFTVKRAVLPYSHLQPGGITLPLEEGDGDGHPDVRLHVIRTKAFVDMA